MKSENIFKTNLSIFLFYIFFKCLFQAFCVIFWGFFLVLDQQQNKKHPPSVAALKLYVEIRTDKFVVMQLSDQQRAPRPDKKKGLI